MAPAPKISEEQGGAADQGAASVEDAGLSDHRDGETGAQSAPSDAAEVNLGQQGYGTLKQSLTNHWKVQER